MNVPVTALLLALLAAPAAHATTPAGVDATIRLEASLSDRTLRVLAADGSELKTYPITIGKERHPTPTGSFNIRRIIWNPRWVPPDSEWARNERPREPGDPANPMGRAKIFFRAPTYYIHGTNDVRSLGRAASHGCIRLRNEDVMDLARLLMEHGGATRPESWFQRVISRVRSSEEVHLARPIPLAIRA
jgi:lipoprotein-anchoring transpeptidase ErfK/SrfK